jgi:hypothetical protein
METFIVIWLACGVLCAVVAGWKCRSAGLWLLAGVAFGVFALVAVLAAPPVPERA